MELGIDTRAPVQLYGDNQGAIALAKNPTLHHRSRHIHIREHFVRDQVRLGTIQVDYVDTKTMVADIFTKALGPLVFKSSPLFDQLYYVSDVVIAKSDQCISTYLFDQLYYVSDVVIAKSDE
ncbi:BZ3500_MvSof-1268-A1-R1_Chr11-2g03469 [Microbotryum saponariae]|uniref:BZ3500_MvSof-1268-A1-R1_Chr11-2g03469 protein n=1 Tax=Microbotryum saponariae TaxID=289078 RepID=A0A2X0LH58_9BASI|nr:BZ3500_MvSof-1268-A1-R1_Chr11-2g03469 [Microbotryum saponariae]